MNKNVCSNLVLEDNDIFEDSSILGKFEDDSFRDTSSRTTLNANNRSLNNSGLNVSALCCDEEISGYDKLLGKTWIYPTNYSVRDYQFNIIRAALVKNTLVSLPTGLGKTFIAAVIMYNFYRWYPLGKIVFTAPTRPLVAQQIDACYNIIGIPPSDSIEMTGNMQANTRKTHWKNKRVFFATPQVIYNDIKSGICPSEHIRCMVFDEAHRARGNYAYCQIIAALTEMGQKTFRVLALSATPGSKVEDVVNVVKNLHIAHLELRTEECIDVAPYSHSRKINTVTINLGDELSQLRDNYVEILDCYARRLKQLNILPHNLGNLSKGRIVMLYKEFQTRDRTSRHPQHNYIMKDFTILIALYHGLELLTKHGSRVFLNFFDEHPEKSWMQSDNRLTGLLERLRDDLGINPLSLDRSILPDGTIPEIPKDLRFGHPKFDKLKEIMLAHFGKAKEKGLDTRAIVFCEYRESVNLVHCLLLQCRPLITAQMFVGQGASGKEGKTVVSQKQQLRVMRSFRDGVCNVLVATCVAEEGLDVGSVDLIVCFDISTRSPIRLVQRCGRTGRERGGQVYILVTEGREHQTLLDCMRQRDGLNKKIQHSKEVESNLYKLNPRMMPRNFTPECQKMYITVEKKQDPKDKTKDNKKGQRDLRHMLGSRASSSGSTTTIRELGSNVGLSKEEFEEMYPHGYEFQPYFGETIEYCSLNKASINSLAVKGHNSKLATWLEWQRDLQKTTNIGHSSDTAILSEILQYSDAKRLNLPTFTQNDCVNSQDLNLQTMPIPSPVKAKPRPVKPKNLSNKMVQKVNPVKAISKNGDIRALFSTATKSTKDYTKQINELGIKNDGSIPTSLIDLLVDLTLQNSNQRSICYLCANACNCDILNSLRKTANNSVLTLSFLKKPILPDISLLDDIHTDTIAECLKRKDKDSMELHTSIDNEKIEITTEHHNVSKNFELEFDFLSPNDSEPKNEMTSITENKPQEKFNVADTNFDLGDIEDIFDDSSPEEVIQKEVVVLNKDTSDPKEALGFFGLDSIDDIFADSDNSDRMDKKEDETYEPIKRNIDTAPNSPPTFANDAITEPTSPILCSQIRRNKSVKNSNKSKKVIQDTSVNETLSKVSQNRPQSPSILSGRSKNIEPTSPIFGSQARKYQLTTKKLQPNCSTPISLSKPKEFTKLNNPEINIIDITEKADSKLLQTSNNVTNNKSLFTITQLVEMINKTGECSDKETLHTTTNDKERSVSPILLTQTRKQRSNVSLPRTSNNSSQVKKSESLIILDSDSDSNDTVLYDAVEQENKSVENSPITCRSPLSAKRKFDESINSSPYFNKKMKLDNAISKPLTLQQKIIVALNSNDVKSQDKSFGKPVLESQKENFSAKISNVSQNSPLKRLEMFRKEPKVCRRIFKKDEPLKKRDFSDSDDDFVSDQRKDKNEHPKKTDNDKNTANDSDISIIGNKRKRKKHRANGFLDLEAELSDSDEGSGDELSDESVGSIIDFICDDEPEPVKEDMYAHYMRSVTSPVNGVFKIPNLPKQFEREEIFSQVVEEDEDSYEMDSFCVDTNMGLTQVNDISELELAEQKLERRRRGRRKLSSPESYTEDTSPVVKRPNRCAKRRISSDSDSS